MRNKAISTFYALPCLVSAAALYSANKLRKQNKELKADEQAARRELEECRERADILENCVKMGLADQHRAEQERDAVKLELEQVRSASRDIIDETMRELELVYEWIRACGYVDAELQNTLQQEFHGNVPSEIYRRKKNEQKMQAALASGE
jgi:hypothetical protein